VRKNGSQFWAHVILTPLLDEPENRAASEIITTSPAQARRRRPPQLRRPAESHLAAPGRVQEAEAQAPPRELHDRVGQNLTRSA